MDSKLPKPSGLRKPEFRSFVPSDRMISGTQQSSIAAKATVTLTNNQFTAPKGVLTQNFENVCNALGQRPMKRRASPEPRMNPERVKLRRSLSVNDIDKIALSVRDAKAAKAILNGGVTKAKFSAFVAPARPALSRVASTVAARAKPGIKPQARLNTTAAIASANKIENKTGAVPKAMTKKIPPYDFKARFHDLSEKHKALKEKHANVADQLADFEKLQEEHEQIKVCLDKIENELETSNNQVKHLETENADFKNKIETLSSQLDELVDKYNVCKAKKEKFEQSNVEMSSELVALKKENEQLKAERDHLKKDNDESKEIFYKFNLERKDLHNMIMDLRGNIRVFCRIRPPLPNEMNRALCSMHYNDEQSIEIVNFEGASKKQVRHEFSFDQIFSPTSSQRDIFESVSPLVQSALDGYNICIFAYGQTGSGKTFTMDGAVDNLGIIPSTIDLLYNCFEQNLKYGWQYQLKASFLEIYNENLYDLLSNESKDMDIKLANPKSQTEIYVSNLTEVIVENKDELHKLVFMAKANRATASTVGNERSSRSHAVTQLCLTGYHEEKGETCQGTINLIDLAGSESPKTSVRMDETKNINKSLSELTNVIMALVQKNDHVPYRNSKLTYLLMPCLGGNSKTLMFVNVSPFQDCYVETMKSLRFATNVNSCKVAKAKRNKVYTNSMHAPSTSMSNQSMNSTNSL